MSSVDERVVEMKFNNSQFQNGVRSTQKALEDLKRGLNLDAAKKSLQGLDEAGKRFNLAGLAAGTEDIRAKFSAVGVAGLAVIGTLTAKAVDAGLQMARGLLDPIKDGFSEYETQLNSVQTILANTSMKGSTLTDVNAALDELNAYSDKTIYNFGEMARNIGTFTAAGVDLNTSTSAIKGIANLAAVSGSNSQQASTAMYQLSQALAAGKVSLMDWNSVVNAGMGGEVFQNALKETARNQGVAIDDIIAKNGSFRDSLQEGWLTSSVLTETLSKFTGDLNDEQLRQMGYTSEQIVEIQKLAVTASDAATKVKSVTQLIGTLQEAAGSGWASSFEILFGDFEEAKVLFTSVSNVLGGMIGAQSKARNDLLQGWKDLGGRTAAIDSIKNVFDAVMSVATPVREAFREIFPPTSAKTLYDITVAIRDFTAGLKLGGEDSANLKSTMRGLFAVLDIGRMILFGILGVIGDVFGGFGDGNSSVLNLTGGIGDLLVGLRNFLKEGIALPNFFTALGAVISVPIDLIKALGRALVSLFDNIQGIDLSALGDVFGRFADRIASLAAIGPYLVAAWEGVKKFFSGVAQWMAPGISAVSDAMTSVKDALVNAFKSGDFDGVTDLINVGLLGAIALMIRNFFKGGLLDVIKEAFGGGKKGIVSTIKETFGGLTDTMGAMQTQLKAGTLMKIAIAIGILTASVVALSLIDSEGLTRALSALTVMFTQLMVAMTIFGKIALGPGIVKVPILAAGLILLGVAIAILVPSVRALSELNWEELTRGLLGLAGVMTILVVASKLMSKNAPGMIAAGTSMVILSVGLRIMADVLQEFAKMNLGEIATGLVGVAGSLAIVAGAMRLMPKTMAAQAVALVVISSALLIMSKAMTAMGGMSWDEVGRGMTVLSGTLAVLAGALRLMSGTVTGAAAMVIAAFSLTLLTDALSGMGSMDWGEIGKSLVVLAGSLLILAGGLYLMTGSLPGAAALIVAAAALVTLSEALNSMGGMDWGEIGKALVILAGALLILAVGLTAMLVALPGAAALVVAAGALTILVPVLQALGDMSWEEIGTGLTVLAATLAILAIAGVALLPAIPGLLGLGASILMIGVGALAAGIGIGLFATGLATLAGLASVSAAAITVVFLALINLIPLLFQKLGEGLIMFAGVIATSGPALTAAFTAVIQSFLDSINTLAPQIVSTLIKLIFLLVDTLVSNVPRLVEAGLKLLTGILNGIANNISQLITAGTNVIVNFMNGISANLPRVIQAGINMIVSFVNGLANGIRDNQTRMREAGLNLATAIIDGMTGGLASGASKALNAAKEMAGKALQAAKDVLGINSPSKEFFKIGNWIDEGAADGIDRNAHKVSTSAENMGSDAISVMKRTMSNLSSIVSDEMDSNPTIRPVLDLSDIQSGAGQISGMFSNPTIDAGRTYSSAATIQKAKTFAGGEQQQMPVASETPVKTINYEQNIYSPKALTPTEVYRQTRNLVTQKGGKDEL